ncbi:hypothetical protein FRB94_004795 [Tulasnella sp. JGI-2019a]|nr:hypothetical protein FRB94_004795 [Tulasnella sp. JGI-2019a]KAG9033354.1 hypothetical protein FRB95_014896 [Tulasnella sp. JGI-2019a]
MASQKLPILVLAGVGAGGGTGAATAKLFAKSGYRVALIARSVDSLKSVSNSLNAEGGKTAPFPVEAYTQKNMESVFSSIKQTWPDAEIRVTIFNAGKGVFKPFLETTEQEMQESVDTNVVGAFAFARESILTFQDLQTDEQGKKGTLIFTGATAGIRGNVTTSAFSAGKHGLRALSQSLAKEFGKQHIHVAHAIIDGVILTTQSKQYVSKEKQENPAGMLSPDSIAKAYLYLTTQDQSAFTWELDLRPAEEKW